MHFSHRSRGHRGLNGQLRPQPASAGSCPTPRCCAGCSPPSATSFASTRAAGSPRPPAAAAIGATANFPCICLHCSPLPPTAVYCLPLPSTVCVCAIGQVRGHQHVDSTAAAQGARASSCTARAGKTGPCHSSGIRRPAFPPHPKCGAANLSGAAANGQVQAAHGDQRVLTLARQRAAPGRSAITDAADTLSPHRLERLPNRKERCSGMTA